MRLPCLLLAAAVTAVPLPAQSRFDLREVAWTVAPDLSGDVVHMEMRLDPLLGRDRTLLRIPLWRPGSYRYASFQDRIEGLRALDQTGTERRVRNLDPRTWEIDSLGATALLVLYDLQVQNDARTGETPSIHLHGPASFLYLEDALRLPHTLRFELPEGWEAASGHRPDPGRPGLYYSPDYDVLVDCPIALGAMERYRFDAVGRPFEVVLFGRPPAPERLDRPDWVRTVRKIVEAAHGVMGPPPFERYVFLFQFYNRGGIYGLEHLNSTTIATNLAVLRQTDGLRSLESVTAHEYFHLWNVKRIRPRQLGPFDYASDVRTRDLWWLEGLTSYYADVILQRAGLRPQENWFWQAQAQVYRGLRRAPGFGKLSPERASWTVWEDSLFPRISYYDQGQVLGLLLDIQIRAETGNRRSLDDVLRFLSRWVADPGPGYRPGDLERAVRAVTGWDCTAFFDRYVAGVLPPPFDEVLPRAGLQVVSARPGDPYLGFGVDEDLQVKVTENSPAFEAGLRPGDRILALDGQPIGSAAALRLVISRLSPGGEALLEVDRSGARTEVRLPVQERRTGLFLIRPAPAASPGEQAIREGVLQGVPAPV